MERKRNTCKLQEIFPSAAYPCSHHSLFHTLLFLFTRHGGIVNICSILFALCCLLCIHFNCFSTLCRVEQRLNSSCRELQLLLCGIMWLIVPSVSSICCYIYGHLIWLFPWKWLTEQQSAKFRMICVIGPILTAIFGVVSTYTLFQLLLNMHNYRIEFSFVWEMFWYITAILRVLERILEVVFITLVLPVTQKWANQLNSHQVELILELLPWKLFLYVHRVILFTTFFGKPLSYTYVLSSLHISTVTFWVFFFMWQLSLVLYVNSNYKPSIRQEIDTEKQVEKSEIVCTARMKPIYKYPPNSGLVTGIARVHPCHSTIKTNHLQEKDSTCFWIWHQNRLLVCNELD